MRTTWARAIVRALIASKDKKKNSILCNIYHKNGQVRGFGARARTRSARQSILLIKKMFLDFLIASVAKKLADLAQIEVKEKHFKNGWVATNLKHSTFCEFLTAMLWPCDEDSDKWNPPYFWLKKIFQLSDLGFDPFL